MTAACPFCGGPPAAADPRSMAAALARRTAELKDAGEPCGDFAAAGAGVYRVVAYLVQRPLKHGVHAWQSGELVPVLDLHDAGICSDVRQGFIKDGTIVPLFTHPESLR